jgi:hydroxymethylbilane synthase
LERIIKIGTRASKLALWQANHIASKLKMNGIESQLVTIETTGDKMLHKSIAKIGSKGVFTEELEIQLHSGAIDIAVHSAKDMQAQLAPDLEIIAYTEREKVNDVLVSFNKYFTFDESQKVVLGTSSTRRIAMIRHYFPKVKTVDARGNLQTRMRKMEEGLCDALMLAYAGVHRMDMDSYVVQLLSPEKFTPAAGQGSIAIEASTNLDKEARQMIREAINHHPTEYQIIAERSYLKHLQGGCSVPAFALASINGEKMTLHCGIISLNGRELIREEAEMDKDEGDKLGEVLAKRVIQNGGEKILNDIKKQIG